MASKARQSLFGGFFELSLNLVIFSFFMRLGSSRRNDANDSAPHRVGNRATPIFENIVHRREMIPLNACRKNAKRSALSIMSRYRSTNLDNPLPKSVNPHSNAVGVQHAF